MPFDSPRKRWRSKHLVVGIVLAGGIGLSLLACHFSAQYAHQLLIAELTEEADVRIGAFSHRFRRAMTANMAPINRFRSRGQDRRTMFHDLAEARPTSNDDVDSLMWASLEIRA